jgi:protocatechuate 3,4-dioxygenase beta subunit
MTTLTLALLSAVLAIAAGQQPGGAVTDRPATIHGRVTDKNSGEPIASAVVSLAREDGTERRTMTTNNAGEFRFEGLGPGWYSGMVQAGRFRATHQPAILAMLSGRYRPIELKPGEAVEVDVALQRTLAIDVRVIDEWGDPLSGLLVAADAPGGGRRLSGSMRTTDDLGRIRLFGLVPGSYVICAEPASHARFTASRMSAPRDALLRTCYHPAGDGSAGIVRLEDSERDVEIVMRRGRVATISGRVIDAAGAPVADAMFRMSEFATNGSRGTGARLEPDGTFRIAGVQPGNYAIEVTVGGPDRPEQRRPLEAAFVPLHVDGTDIEDLLVALRRGVDVHGRVTLDDPSATLPPSPGSGLMLFARLAEDRSPGSGSSRMAIVRTDRTFTFEGVFGPRTFDFANVPRGWFVKAVRYHGRDVLDDAVEFKEGGAPSLEVVLSNRGAYVTGRVTDDRGQPVPRARLFAISADVPIPAQLHRGTASASATGEFRIGPLRGGEYYIVALTSAAEMLQMGQWDRIASLISGAERITVGDLEQRAIDLRVTIER